MINVEYKLKRKGTTLKLFAFVGKRCVAKGMVWLYVFDVHTAVIMDLFVRPEDRHHGYGTSLVQECIIRAATFPNIHRIWMQDGSDNYETSKIARKLGFNLYRDDVRPIFTLALDK